MSLFNPISILFFRFFGIILTLGLLVWPVSAQGQASAPAKGGSAGTVLPKDASASDLDILLKTLENPGEREKLTRQIRALIRQRKAGEGAREATRSVGRNVTFVQVYERLVGRIQKGARRASVNLKALPEQAGRIARRLKERDAFLSVLDWLWKLGVAIFVALGFSLLVRKYTVRASGRLTVDEESGGGRKFLVSVGLSLLRVVPPGAMLVSVFIVLTVLQPAALGAAVVLTAVWAYFFRTVLMAVARIFIASERPSIRFLPLKDEAAAYWNIWVRRLTGYGVFGYYAVRILQSLGASKSWTDALFELYGAGLVVQLFMLILQQRKGTKAPSPGAASEEELWIPAQVGRNLLRTYWHVVAFAYLIVGYGLWALDYPDALGLMVRASLYTLLLVALCLVVRHFLGILLRKLFQIPERVAARFPGLEGRVNRYIRITHRVFFGLLYLITAFLILEAWRIRFFDFLFSDLGLLIMFRVFSMAAVLAIAFVVLEGGHFAAEALLHVRVGPDGREEEPSARLRTLVPLGRTTLKVAVIVVTALILMGQIGINITPVLAGVGVLGLAVGFGAQSLVKDIISGMFIILEDSISVGDVVILKGTGAMVENINLRTIRMRDLSGNVHVIPHSSVDMITNMTKDYSRYLLDVGVAYREDTDQVVEILKAIGAEMQADPEYGQNILEPIEIMGVDRFEDSAVIVRARLTTKPIKQWNIGREFNRRMKKAFDERGIEIPFPHQTLYFGEPKEGTPPPLYMEQVARAFEKRDD